MTYELLFESWPRRVGTTTVEPVADQLRVKPLGQEPLWLSMSDALELAHAANGPKRSMLLEAIREAQRQGELYQTEREGV